ncbi:hypothetical protein HNR21_004810 [Actinomadura cellulosilytica]|uniref:HTH cro/C1-type domain-containing protein n=1 Tax=Thermomonospora cellulosilytica TaxID=1411118 RepID=A0A7W3N1T1_9ACTN|nr:hypothetical protein [Thermomonospora cellulosilytica]
MIKKIEQGGTARMETYHKLAKALGVRTVWFVSASSPEPVEAAVDDTVLADMRSAINPPIGLAGKPLYGTADAELVDLRSLKQAISSVAAAYHGDRYDDLAQMMPALVRSAHHHVDYFDSEGPDRREALRLRADITGLTGRYLIQIRAHDLALIALHASLRDALEIGHTPLAAAAVCSQAWAMMRQGRLSEVEQLCVATADQIEPKMSKATPDELCGWGYMFLRAAAAAARNNRMEEAREYASIASTAGTRLGRQYQDLSGHKAFGPMNGPMLAVEIEMLDDRPDKALELAAGIPRDVGRGNTSGWDRHRLDLAVAHARTGNVEKAEDILTAIRREHPHWLRYQQYARDAVRELMDARPRMPSQRTRELADFMGINM